MTKDDKKHKEVEIEDLTSKWKRALADYQNLERRVKEEKDDFVKFANATLLLEILPALDSLEKAQAHLQDEGLRLALKQLWEALESEGLQKIEAVGQDFDPQQMECVEVAEGEEGKVLDEIRRGYKLNERLLRPAQVKVGKAKIDKDAVAKAAKEEQGGDYV